MSKLFLAALALAASAAGGAEIFSTRLPAEPEAKLEAEARSLLRSLGSKAQLGLGFQRSALPLRGADGAWRPEALAEVLGQAGPVLKRGGKDPGGEAGLAWEPAPADAVQLWAQGLPKVLCIENSSTVAPLSKGLQAWGLEPQVRAPEDVEKDPAAWLDAGRFDLIVFSSPGWWDDFANPPGGPSRMGEPLAKALRSYVSAGGAALFFDIAQWDLEKAWPKTLRLAPLGPYRVSTLATRAGLKGGLSLAPVGVAADQLKSKSSASIISAERFAFPDGKRRPIHAAYAVADPKGGKGWVMGWAFHPFEQDDSLSNAGRRLLLNAILFAGDRRVQAEQAEAPSPTPSPSPSLTASPSRSATASYSPSPTLQTSPTETPTLIPSATALPSPVDSLTPSPTASGSPTMTPSAEPTLEPSATPLPTWTLTRVPTALPTLKPSAVPTALPTPKPSAVPTARPTPKPTARPTPTERPSRGSKRRALPLYLPPPALPTLQPTKPVPTLVPTRALPTWAPPPTLVLPTREPTRARSVASPVPSPTAVLLKTLPTVVLAQGVRNHLGCLESSPEPFDDGGVYLRYCLSEPAQVTVSVFDSKGKLLWQEESRKSLAGQYQCYFSGKVHGILVTQGGYLFEVKARYADGLKESRQGAMRREKRRR